MGKSELEVMGLSDWLARQEGGWVLWMGGCDGGGARQIQKGGEGVAGWYSPFVLPYPFSCSFLASPLSYRLMPCECEDFVYPRRVPQLCPTQEELIRP